MAETADHPDVARRPTGVDLFNIAKYGDYQYVNKPIIKVNGVLRRYFRHCLYLQSLVIVAL